LKQIVKNKNKMPWTLFNNDDPHFQWVKRLEGVWYLVRKKRSYEDQICAVVHEENGEKMVEWRFYNRVYYMKVRWLKDRSANLPHPYCDRCYYDFETFDWGDDSDDEEGTLTAIDPAGKVMWVEDMKSGHLLEDGEMVIPGAGIFRVRGCMGEFAEHTGRIIPTNDKWARTFFEGEKLNFDVYEFEEWGRDDDKKKVRHPRLMDLDEDVAAKHPGNKLYEEVPCLSSPRRKALQQKVMAEVLAKSLERGKRKVKREKDGDNCKCTDKDCNIQRNINHTHLAFSCSKYSQK
jgi:hypothetical protein